MSTQKAITEREGEATGSVQVQILGPADHASDNPPAETQGNMSLP
jgi:hypothetical protein